MRAGLPRIRRGFGETMVGPSIMVHGTEEQQKHFLPRIITAEDVYCQGFSEPEQGSDLGGVQTRATVVGDEVVVTGQKVWTSGFYRANMIFVLCRTDAAAPKHKGLSYVLLPMRDNNIDARPAQAAHRLRRVRRGVHRRRPGAAVQRRRRVEQRLAGRDDHAGPRARRQRHDRAPALPAAVRGARGAGAGEGTRPRPRRPPGAGVVPHPRRDHALPGDAADGAARRGPRTRARRRRSRSCSGASTSGASGEIAAELLGADALVRPEGEGYRTSHWQGVFLASRAGTIFSGTSEIQRNIIAERALGLPREPAGVAR